MAYAEDERGYHWLGTFHRGRAQAIATLGSLLRLTVEQQTILATGELRIIRRNRTTTITVT